MQYNHLYSDSLREMEESNGQNQHHGLNTFKYRISSRNQNNVTRIK